MFAKEQGSNLYSPTAYFIARVISELPMLIISPSIFSVIVYFGLGLNTTDGSHFIVFWLYNILLSMVSAGAGFAIGAIFKEKMMAVTMVGVIIVPFMLYCGFFINQQSMNPIVYPFEYVSIFKYGYQALMINEFDGITIN